MTHPDRSMPIGIFDSGLGGLTVAAAVRKQLPFESILYLGDTARLPYGNRSPETVRRFAAQDMDFLLRFGVKTVIAACNTVSATALESLCERSEIPVSGVILPGVREAIRSGAGSIAVLGTRGTIRSGAYERELRKLRPDLRIRSIACPLFVPLAEEGILSGPAVMEILDLCLHELKKDPPDLILPGCTHYPLLKEAIQAYLPGVRIADCAAACAKELEQFLRERDLLADDAQKGGMRFFVTDFPQNFETQAGRFLGKAPGPVEKAEIC